jgi:hypothetical protein
VDAGEDHDRASADAERLTIRAVRAATILQPDVDRR